MISRKDTLAWQRVAFNALNRIAMAESNENVSVKIEHCLKVGAVPAHEFLRFRVTWTGGKVGSVRDDSDMVAYSGNIARHLPFRLGFGYPDVIEHPANMPHTTDSYVIIK